MVTRLVKKIHPVCEYPKVHNRVPKGPPLKLIVSQLKPDHTLASYLFKIHFNTTRNRDSVVGIATGYGLDD
jgi:hypothetical protein